MTKYCPACGEKLVDSAKFCKSCGKNLENLEDNSDVGNIEYDIPVSEKSYTAAIIVAYLLAIFIPLIGIILAIYLITRKDSSSATMHGKYVLILGIVVWIISFLF